ncbi:coniferyl aldehyde dehydrogenase [Exilibacterium tricleocarpae]|uniref:Aldehyde dehydrogenase n=1 Tax=Exilibacterium tricleocarpae TaxID=2591008 RepID=A0A545U5P8_9GAMM|nr:coniferyl aldehyde dehydrogenase [Exilibacterium tricleocarpae]TQV84787.1 coniferyl aldehyde dehydrogenase [Exilibacterium tricleocarpae]
MTSTAGVTEATREKVTEIAQSSQVSEMFNRQRDAYFNNPYPTLEERRRHLLALENLLRDNQDAIAEAIDKDFGGRSVHETQALELFSSIDGLRDCRKKLKKWMKPQRRQVSIWFAGASNTVLPQPKGVVGIVVPWNYPLFLSMGPIANALAAGNRCLVKMAANSQHLCRLLAELVAEKLPPETLTFLPGVSAAEFTDHPFDHLIFTGSPGVGKTVMKKAAEFLTPVTLELGGKSPTIIAEDFDIKAAAERIVQSKLYNAGQTCVAPDYLFVPRHRVDEFIEQARRVVAKRYGRLETPDYTAIIDTRAYSRLLQTLDDAERKGARPISLLEGVQPDNDLQKIPPTLLLDVGDDMTVMQEEIFGPLLPIKPYENLDDVLAFINAKERPLALYLFSNDKKLQQQVLTNTISGGVCINDCMMHPAQHDLPFGGIGNSGMGHYHGYEGFVEFSKLRPVFKQARLPGAALLAPPYGKLFDFLYKLMVK